MSFPKTARLLIINKGENNENFYPPHSIEKKNIRFSNLVFLIVFSVFFLPSLIFAHTQEWLMQITSGGKPGYVLLKVYNNLGQQVAKLVDKEQSSGRYEVNFRTENLASGIYFYKITANGFTAVKKMILMK